MNLALFIPELCLAAFAILVIVLDLFIRQKELKGYAGQVVEDD